MKTLNKLKIALVHDDLVQWGGAERVLAALSDLFPEAPIYTSLYDSNNFLLTEKFGGKKIIASFLQKIPGWKSLYKTLLPLYPFAFESFDFRGFDLVISQTTRFAKAVITRPETLHICYCHTPPRFLWNFSKEKVNPLLKPYFKFLKRYDFITSKRVDFWLAGSHNASERIKDIYHSSSNIIYPFVDLKRFASVESFDGGYFLTVCRLNKYKKVDILIKAANKLNKRLVVVGRGPEEDYLKSLAGPKVEFYQNLNEDTLTLLLAGCEALLIACEEDFGLTALEAQSLGKPVIAYRGGGVLETVIEGQTGYFFNEQKVDDLICVLQLLEKKGYNKQSLKFSLRSNYKKKCLEQAEKFSLLNFQKNFLQAVDKICQ